MSRELTEASIPHVVLERGRVGQTWREHWDSFCLVTPNWSVRLPGHPYDGGDPYGFMSRAELVAYFERYAAGFGGAGAGAGGTRGHVAAAGIERRLPSGDDGGSACGTDGGPQHGGLPTATPTSRGEARARGRQWPVWVPDRRRTPRGGATSLPSLWARWLGRSCSSRSNARPSPRIYESTSKTISLTKHCC